MKKEKAAFDNGSNQRKIVNDVSSITQRKQILDYLQRYGSATTLEIRNELHILSPAPRILELRTQGHKIITHRDDEVTPDGKNHRIARYVLQSGVETETAA